MRLEQKSSGPTALENYWSEKTEQISTAEDYAEAHYSESEDLCARLPLKPEDL